MHWARIYLGVGLAALSVCLLRYVWDAPRGPLWWVGALSGLAGLLFLFSGIYIRTMQKLEAAAGDRPMPEFTEDRPPLLGELLVYKYRLITAQALKRALAMQRKTKQLLGEVLLSTGELTSADLEMVLKDQATYKNGMWRQEPWAQQSEHPGGSGPAKGDKGSS